MFLVPVINSRRVITLELVSYHARAMFTKPMSMDRIKGPSVGLVRSIIETSLLESLVSERLVRSMTGVCADIVSATFQRYL